MIAQAVAELKLILDEDDVLVTVFESNYDDGRKTSDKADLYAVVGAESAIGGVVVYGYHAKRDEWLANWSSRHVVRHLIDAIYDVKNATSIQDVAAIVKTTINYGTQEVKT